MTEWRPTKPGVYLRGQSIVAVADAGGLHISMEVTSMRVSADEPERLFSVHGHDCTVFPQTGWSLPSPDKQDGPPTPEQLVRWPWWAVWAIRGDIGTPAMAIGRWRIDHLDIGEDSDETLTILQSDDGWVTIPTDEISHSAPIQPGWSEGPRWVPRAEVCGAK